MKRLVSVCLLLSACAHHGNLAHAPAGYDGKMAQDTAKAMRVVWPPEHTELKTDVTHPDPFQQVLVEHLRSAGYAVSPMSSKTGSELRYVVDRLDDRHYRVSIRIDGHSLHRLYRTSQGQLMPASLWSRQD